MTNHYRFKLVTVVVPNEIKSSYSSYMYMIIHLGCKVQVLQHWHQVALELSLPHYSRSSTASSYLEGDVLGYYYIEEILHCTVIVYFPETLVYTGSTEPSRFTTSHNYVARDGVLWETISTYSYMAHCDKKYRIMLIAVPGDQQCVYVDPTLPTN